jgi:diacylglycerol kinase family enzyme
MRPVTVIVNRSSGSAAGKLDDLHPLLARAGLNATVMDLCGDQIAAAATRASRAGHVVIAAGGDGTVSTVAGIAVRSGATFGVIPLGTLNHFARDAGIPLDLEKAVAAIAAGRSRALDVGIMNDAVFINNASLGLYPQLVWERQQEQSRGRRKSIAFFIALVRTWRRYPTVVVHMTVDGVVLVRRTPFVFIGNGEYRAEGMGIGTRASVDSGTLGVYLAPGIGRVEFLRLPIRALRGQLRSEQKFESFRACEITIETGAPHVDVALDGELKAAKTPLRFSIRRGALMTLLPDGA